MDPTANLARQKELADEIIQLCDSAGEAGHTLAELCEIAELAAELSELSAAYHAWILAGGFPAHLTMK